MKERYSEDQRMALILPKEVKITPKGKEILYDLYATDQETEDMAAQELGKMNGWETTSSSSKAFGLAGLSWKGSKWEPEGPKKNWSPPPSFNNPELN